MPVPLIVILVALANQGGPPWPPPVLAASPIHHPEGACAGAGHSPPAAHRPAGATSPAPADPAPAPAPPSSQPASPPPSGTEPVAPPEEETIHGSPSSAFVDPGTPIPAVDYSGAYVSTWWPSAWAWSLPQVPVYGAPPVSAFVFRVPPVALGMVP